MSVGSVFLKDNAKGTVIEVDYKPSPSPQCHKLLDEFVGYLGPFDTDTQQYISSMHSEYITGGDQNMPSNVDFNPMHNITLDYVNVFRSMGVLSK